MVKYSEEQIPSTDIRTLRGQSVLAPAPVVKGRKGHYKELFKQFGAKATSTFEDGEMRQVDYGMKPWPLQTHDIEVVIDKLIVKKDEKRLRESVKSAMKQGDSVMMVMDKTTASIRYFSRQLMCPSTGLASHWPCSPQFFIQHPQRCLSHLQRIGCYQPHWHWQNISTKIEHCSKRHCSIRKEKIHLSFGNWVLSAKNMITLKTPIAEISTEGLDEVLNGSTEQLHIRNKSLGQSTNYLLLYEGGQCTHRIGTGKQCNSVGTKMG